ncbi:hypothetical protein QBC38DRAFT_505369 [Podospora fimiseda]|uniref:Zn(2)-C6 fungal-type domain-containing protein n=1 Tax=Podospora fimiseda TaxID=252190 RepID=A0AAN7BCN2_9PEZI|nr:hypothetical protein QBC38DRAFT_505369 [Podospora fimiseda]
MSGPVTKSSKSNTSHIQTVQRDALLEAVLRIPIKMVRAYSHCERKKIPCEASPSTSSGCTACIQNNQAYCDVFVGAEMEEAEAARAELDAKINRLRLQKRKWKEDLARALARGVDSVEELEKLEQEEAEAAASAAIRESEFPVSEVDRSPLSFGDAGNLDFSGVDWSSLDPSLLSQGGLGSVGETAGTSPGSPENRQVPTS